MNFNRAGGFAGCLIVTVALGGSAVAEDFPAQKSQPLPSWTGFYGGLNTGGEFGDLNVADPNGRPPPSGRGGWHGGGWRGGGWHGGLGPSSYGGRVSTPGAISGLQAGYNWQAPGSNWVFGLQVDADLASSDGVNTCLAMSARCQVRPVAMGSLTGRVGYALGPTGRTLLYVKGGGAVIDEKIDTTTNGVMDSSSSANQTRLGWTLGAGLEYALTNAWSIGFEYDYMRFGPFDVTGPSTVGFVTLGGIPVESAHIRTPGSSTRATQEANQFKVALNYHFGGDLPGDPSATSFLPFLPTPESAPSAWEFEFGPRYWYSVGKFQKGFSPPALRSQLTYANMDVNSAELFARVESPWNVFLKGYVGLGAGADGRMNDEDWTTTFDYSNTVSSTHSSLSFAVVDLGYDWMRSSNFKLGSFVGYFRDQELMKAYGCTQTARPSADCLLPIPTSTVGIRESDTWQALRLGASSEVMLTDSLKLTTDAAYLPYVSFAGLDDHYLRGIQFLGSGRGQGVQLESVLSYDLTKNWSVGVGARYWAAWTDHASYSGYGFSDFPAEYRFERYGATLQTSYRFGT